MLLSLYNSAMIRRLLLYAVVLFSLSNSCYAREKGAKFAYKGFSGGMMPHSGYFFGGKTAVYDAQGTLLSVEEMRGLPLGLGGAIRLHFGDHWRLGTEGYSTTLRYGKYNSNVSIGWGGLLADYHWKIGKFKPFGGGTLGGGSLKNMTLLQDNPLDYTTEQAASYRNYPFMAFCPFVGMEYSLSDKMHLIFKIDYLMNLSNPQDDFVKGPRIYLGVMFHHLKN